MLGKAVFISASLTVGVFVINGLGLAGAGFNKVAIGVLFIAWFATYWIWGCISPDKNDWEEPAGCSGCLSIFRLVGGLGRAGCAGLLLCPGGFLCAYCFFC